MGQYLLKKINPVGQFLRLLFEGEIETENTSDLLLNKIYRAFG